MNTDCLVPVLDVWDGQVVWATQGERKNYRPIESKLAESADPVKLALAVRDAIGTEIVYIADLDSLVNGQPPKLEVIEALLQQRFLIWMDAAWSEVDDSFQHRIHELVKQNRGQIRPILSSEAHSDYENLATQFARWKEWRPIFSFDLKNGVPIWDGQLPEANQKIAEANQCAIQTHQAIVEAVQQAVCIGFASLIVLDIGYVGSGVPGVTRCLNEIQVPGELELISGGGVNDPTDVDTFLAAGCQQVLVSTALHRGVW